MQVAGSLERPDRSWFQRTFRHIGASTSWSLGLFFFFFYFTAFVSFLTDAVRVSSFEPLWFIVSGAAFIPPVVIVVFYRYTFLERRPERSRPIINLLVAALAGASRNVSVGLFASLAGLDPIAELWAFRFIGGSFLGVGVYTLWAVVNGAKIEYLSALRTLEGTQTELLATREHMPENIARINSRLQERTRNALIPQLGAIRELLGQNTDVSAIVDGLRSTIANQIRPLMSEISKDQPKPFQERNFRKLKTVTQSLPARFTLSDKILVTWSSFLALLGAGLWLVILGSKNGILDAIALFFIYFTILGSLKLLTPRTRVFKKEIAIAINALFALTASSGNIAYIIFVMNPEPNEMITYVSFTLISGMIGPIMLLQYSVRAEKRNQIEARLTEDLNAIAKENSLFAQRLWVFRKRWLLVLHGNVQSSLTAALTRLQASSEIDPVKLELVKQDLNRAEAAIETNFNEHIDFESAVNELQRLWAGVCDISVKVSQRASRALTRNTDTSFCINEIIKEAVSNAVRHGDATEANVNIDRLSDDVIHLVVANNGKPPKQKPEPGIGSEMLDEICLNWTLDSHSKTVRLVADVPVRI